ncbi:hypothetical protein C8R48DRAFT_124678 [Suillus tomentosus]|nr:hypothetical protein C8R48DRAFT_124678 [Suillus tomentosus]
MTVTALLVLVSADIVLGAEKVIYQEDMQARQIRDNQIQVKPSQRVVAIQQEGRSVDYYLHRIKYWSLLSILGASTWPFLSGAQDARQLGLWAEVRHSANWFCQTGSAWRMAESGRISDYRGSHRPSLWFLAPKSVDDEIMVVDHTSHDDGQWDVDVLMSSNSVS